MERPMIKLIENYCLTTQYTYIILYLPLLLVLKNLHAYFS